MRLLRTLLVDDEPGVLRGLRVLIDWSDHGFDVIATAESGPEALELIATSTPDLVITDIRMPRMDGLEMIRRAQSQTTSPPVFAILTGHREFEYARSAVTLGVVDYLLKPVFEEDLSAALRAIRSRVHARGTVGRVPSLSQAVARAEDFPLFEKPCRVVAGGIDDEALLRRRDSDAVQHCRDRLHRAMTRLIGASEDEALYDSSDGTVTACLSEPTIASMLGDVHGYIRDVRSFVSSGGCSPPSLIVSRSLNGVQSVRRALDVLPRARELLRIEAPCDWKSLESLATLKPGTDPSSLLPVATLVTAVQQDEPEEIRRHVSNSFHAARSIPIEPSLVADYVTKITFDLANLVSTLGGRPADVGELVTMQQIDLRSLSVGGLEALTTEAALATRRFVRDTEKSPPQRLLAGLRRELAETYNQDVSLKQLARRYGFHPTYFGQLFRREFGVSFRDHVNALRVEEAGRLLRRTNARVFEVARRVGYRSTEYFEKRFVRHFGHTPSEHRTRKNPQEART